MAYSKTPEQDTHSKFRIPAKGNQTYTADTQIYSANAGLRYVNCYPVVRESKTAEPTTALMKVPKVSYITWIFPDATDVGISAYDYETNLFVHGSSIYKAVAPTPTITRLKTTTGYTLLSCQRGIDYSGNGEVIILGLAKAANTQQIFSYTYNETTDTFAVGSNALAGDANTSLEVYALLRDIFIDGYHVVATKSARGGTNRVFVSAPGDYNDFSTSTDFFVPEIDPDNIVDIQKHRNFLCVLGTKTIEFFYNAGIELGSPFVRQDNATIKLGAAESSIVQNSRSIAFGDDIYFFANSENGGNAIYMIRNLQAMKISDDYIDYILNDQTGVTTNIDPTTAILGVADVMGNIQLTLSFRDPNTNLLTAVFVFNERDMVWWEWSKSDTTGFLTDSIGYGSNLTGKPLILSGQVLGIGTNVQHSVIVPGVLPYYTYDNIQWFKIDTVLSDNYSKVPAINAALQKVGTIDKTFSITVTDT